MPLPHRQSQASLRRARSIPANILQSAKIEEDQRVRPEVARQYALAAANRAFQLAQAAKEEDTITKSDSSNAASTMPQRRAQRLTDDTLVNDESLSMSDDTIGRTPRDARGARFGNVKSTPDPEAPPSTGTGNESAAATRTGARTASVPSSFQKMSKPKSTVSLRKSASPEKFSSAGSGGRQTPTLRRSLRQSPTKNTFPTGLSPGRALPTAEELLQRLPNPHHSTYNQDQAVQIARDEFLRQLQEQNGTALRSSTVKNDRSKIAKHFRHTLRRISNANEDNSADANGAVEDSNAETKPRSRRISTGFKATIKRIFRGSSSRSFPAQQVDATRKHYDSIHDEDDDPNDPIRYPVIPAPCPEMVARLSLRQSHDTIVPSPTSVRHSHPPSIRSMRSSESLRTGSRVTSWANSATSKGTYLTAGLDPSAQDRARLSVIQEHAPHRPSASAPRHQENGSPRRGFEEPMQLLRDIHGVDTEKMAREIRENIRRKCAAAGSEDYNGTNDFNSTIRHRPNGENASHRGRCSTLRAVGVDSEDDWSPQQHLRMRKQRGITYPSSDDDDVFEPSVPRLRWKTNRSLHHKLSLQDIANLNEGPIASKRHSLRESRSTFFPGKGQYPNYELSPYRKAMKASLEKDPIEVCSLDREVTPIDSQESASLYSRKTSGTPYANAVFDPAEGDAGHGIAYVDERPVNRYRSLVGKARDTSGTVSHRSSGSWQGWMASEVSKLEGSTDYNADIRLPQDQPGLKGIGHVRESAGEQSGDESDNNTMRSASGSHPALDAVRFFSGFRLPKRVVSNDSKSTASRRGSFTIREDSDASSIKSRLRFMLPGLRAPSNENDRPNSCAPLLSHKQSEPALKLPTVPESPMTPFSKFMASEAGDTGGSPLEGYHLRERAATASNVRHSLERDSRLRRMQSSILAGNKAGRHGPSQYPWLQRYRDSHFYEQLSPANSENKPYGHGAIPKKDQENASRPFHGSMEDDPFPDPGRYRHCMERSSSGEPAFI